MSYAAIPPSRRHRQPAEPGVESVWKPKGYHPLSPDDQLAFDAIQEFAAISAELLEKLSAGAGKKKDGQAYKWVIEGKRDIQKGLMCLRRAVENPEGF